MVDWEFLAYGVWALRYIPKGSFGSTTEWTAVVVAQGDTARIVLGERLNTRVKTRQLLKSISDHHFASAFALRKGSIRWYKLPDDAKGS